EAGEDVVTAHGARIPEQVREADVLRGRERGGAVGGVLLVPRVGEVRAHTALPPRRERADQLEPPRLDRLAVHPAAAAVRAGPAPRPAEAVLVVAARRETQHASPPAAPLRAAPVQAAKHGGAGGQREVREAVAVAVDEAVAMHEAHAQQPARAL